jgi:hypothetical protein
MRKSGWSRRRVARALSGHEYPMRRSLAGYLCTFFVGIAIIVSQNASRNCFLSSTHLESRTIRVLRSSCPLRNLFLGSTAPLTQRFTKISAIDFSSPGLALTSPALLLRSESSPETGAHVRLHETHRKGAKNTERKRGQTNR